MKTHLVQHTQISTLSFPPKLHSSSGCSARSMVSRIEGIWFGVPITTNRLVTEGILLAGERASLSLNERAFDGLSIQRLLVRH